MATGVQNVPPPGTRRRSSGKRTAPPPPHQMDMWRATLIILIAFCMVGIIPMLLIAKVTGQLGVSLPAVGPFNISTPTPTDAPDLNLPRDAWVTQSVDVLPEPGKGNALATLAPAFPVRLLQHQRVGATIWSRIEWNGPVGGTGGTGWAPDNMFISSGHTGSIMGDLGALAPALRQAVTSSGKQFSAMVYFPSQDRLYTQGSADTSFALGTGFRPMLLGALYAADAAAKKPVSLTDSLTLAHGDPTGTASIYQTLGGASGLLTYLSSRSVRGYQPGATWNACQTTPRGLLDFYTLFAGNLLATADRASAISVLSLADAPTTSNLVAAWARASGNLLVVGTAQTGGTWTVSVAGFLNPPNKGPQAIVAAVATGQSSSAAALTTMKAFYTELTTLLAG